MMLTRCLSLVAILVLCWLVACTARPFINQPLTQKPEHREDFLARSVAGERAPELLVMLAFSGGGTRAATMAYGVMQELAATPVHTSRGKRRLLDEVDVISSVSGGSFVSAYYGLFGDRLFVDFEERFLRHKVQTDLAILTTDPINWFKQASPYYGRSDLAANYYDKHFFDNKVFRDLHRPGAPFIIINSTDLGTGARFAFVYPMFDLLCADLDNYPVSRAVMASAAAPIAATPITLQNFAGQCDYQQPLWLARSLQDPVTSLRRAKAESFYEYLDAKQRPWIHLVDGGIADNLALRAFYSFFSPLDNPPRTFEAFGHSNVRKVLIISVNAAQRQQRELPKKGKLPSWGKVVAGWAHIQAERDAADTLYIVRKSYDDLVAKASNTQRSVEFEFAEVSFAALSDPSERDYFINLPTSLELNDEQVDRLIAVGRTLLRESPQFQRFLRAAASD
jgi:NTE family protein